MKIIGKIWLFISDREHLSQLSVCLIFLAFLWFAVFGEQGLYQLHRSARMRSDLKNNISNLEKKIEKLKEEKGLLNNPDYLELVIRQELGYVKPGEVVFQYME